MNHHLPLRIPTETDALENLRSAYEELQHHEIALSELWEASEGGKRLGQEAFLDRILKEVADHADQ